MTTHLFRLDLTWSRRGLQALRGKLCHHSNTARRAWGARWEEQESSPAPLLCKEKILFILGTSWWIYGWKHPRFKVSATTLHCYKRKKETLAANSPEPVETLCVFWEVYRELLADLDQQCCVRKRSGMLFLADWNKQFFRTLSISCHLHMWAFSRDLQLAPGVAQTHR